MGHVKFIGGRLGGPARLGAMVSTGLSPVSRSPGWLAAACLLPPWRWCQPGRLRAV